jgi:putative intracellular protease/amidase
MCHKHKCFPKVRPKHPKPAPEGAPEEASSEEDEDDEEKIVVAIPIFKNVTALDFVGPYEVLHLLPNVKVLFVSHSRDLYSADLAMLSFHSTATFDEVPSPDIIVVPGGGGTHDLLTDAPLLDWIRKVSALITELIFRVNN